MMNFRQQMNGQLRSNSNERSRTARMLLVSLLFSGLLLNASILNAQDVGPGSLSLMSRWDAVRTHSPRFFKAQLNWPLRTLLEGELELECYVGPELQCRFTSYETALSESGMTLPVVLPPPILSRETDNYVIRAEFHGADRTIYLDEHFQAAPVRWKRTSVVGILEDRAGTIPSGLVQTEGETSEFFRSLQLDAFMPRTGRNRQPGSVWTMPAEQELSLLRGWQQVVTHVPPAELPGDPLQLLAFDILMVSTDQLGKLSPSQLDALRLWTQGGGSLAVSVTGAVPVGLESWLNQIAGGRRDQPNITISADGTVNVLQDRGSVFLAYPGIGRSVLVVKPPEVDSLTWRHAVFHLWKIRESQQESVRKSGRFLFDVDQDWVRHDTYEPLPWDVTYDANASVLTSLLLPESVQGVPLWLVCGVLAGCLLVVVPGDYFLLGYLRLQRWTWLTMPLVALGSTWFMVSTANSYMGSRDLVQSLTYVDLNADGEAVRTSQFQLSFPVTSREVVREYQGTLEVDLGEGRSAQPDEFDQSGNRGPNWGPEFVEPGAMQSAIGAGVPALVAEKDVTEYFGTVPGTYSLRRHVNQWTPRISRVTRFGEPDGLSGPPPRRLRELQSSDDGPPEVDAVVAELSQFHPGAAILCGRQGQWAVHLPPDAAERFKAIVDHVSLQTRRVDRGMFHIVDQVSPQGMQLTEDLAMNVEQLVVVVVEANSDLSQFVAWRRLISNMHKTGH